MNSIDGEKQLPLVFLCCGAGSDIASGVISEFQSQYPSASVYTFSRDKLCETHTLSCTQHFITDYTEKSLKTILSSLNLPSQYQLWILVCNGQLTHDSRDPEKSISQLDEMQLSKLWNINVLIPLYFLKASQDLVKQAINTQALVLSAQIGSIADNLLGGWYSYRMTKAALNMALKTLSIEWGRKYKNVTLHPLHPGTTTTKFTEKYVSNRKKGTVCSPEKTGKLIIERFKTIHSQELSGFYHAKGYLLPW